MYNGTLFLVASCQINQGSFVFACALFLAKMQLI